MRQVWVILSLSVLSAVLHLPLFEIGVGLPTGHIAMIALESRRFLQGEWPAFFHYQNYGGAWPGLFRTWVFRVFDLLSDRPDTFLQAQLLCSLFLTPAMMTASFGFLAFRYFRFFAAFFATLSVAVGSCFWDDLFGDDFYFAGWIFSCLLLALRAGIEDPLTELRRVRLFALGLLAGFGTYTFRGTLVAATAATLSPHDLWRGIKGCLSPRTRAQLVFAIGAWAGLGGFFWKELFASVSSNGFNWLLLVGASVWLGGWIPGLGTREVLLRIERLVIAGVGFAVGFWPERAGRLDLWNPKLILPSWFNKDLSEILSVPLPKMLLLASRIPGELRTIFDFPKTWLPGGLNLAYSLLGAGLLGLIMAGVRNRRVAPLALGAMLSLLAFTRVDTYVVGILRYLFPAVLFAFVGLGFVLHTLRGRAQISIGVAILVLMLAGQLQLREDHVDSIRRSERTVFREQAWRQFFARGIPLVFSSHYTIACPLTLASSLRVIFTKCSPAVPLPDAAIRGEIQKLGRIVVEDTLALPTKRVEKHFGRNWEFSLFFHEGRVGMYEGRPAEFNPASSL